MSQDAVGPSRGSQLLKEWQGGANAKTAAELLSLDEASYSRFCNGIRKPSAEVGFRIEKLTEGLVPFKSWWDPPLAERKPARAANTLRRKTKAAS